MSRSESDKPFPIEPPIEPMLVDARAPGALGEPAFAPLRSDPRFTKLKRKLGLA